MFEEVICKMGMPKSVISDKGVNFQSNLFQQLCQLLKIKKVNATFYHPEGVEMVERMVKIGKQILTINIDATQTNWDEYLQSSISAYNTSKQASIKCSPYEALYAREAIKVSNVMLSTPVVVQKETEDVNEYVQTLKSSAADIRVNLQQEKARNVQKHPYDQAVKNSRKYRIEDLIRVVNERSVCGQSEAFKDRAIGPFKAVGVLNDELNYQILSLRDNEINKIHYNRILPYKARIENSFDFHENNLFNYNRVLGASELSSVVVENSNEFDVDFIMSLQVNTPAVRAFGHFCEYCGLGLGTKRKLLQHVNSVHRDLVLQHIQDVIDSVISDVGFSSGCNSSSGGRSSSSSISSVNASSSCSVASSGDASADASSETEVIQVVARQSKFVNCDICGKRFKRVGLHVHMRVHKVQVGQLASDDDTLEISEADVNETVEQVEEFVVQEVCTSSGLDRV